MKKWVILGVFAAMVAGVFGSNDADKGAAIMPDDPIGDLSIKKPKL